MNIHGLKLKKQRLNLELKREIASSISSRRKVLSLENKIKAISGKIKEMR